RTFWTAGSSRPISTAMMAMTTSNSISVNAAGRRAWTLHMELPLCKRQGARWPPGRAGLAPRLQPERGEFVGLLLDGRAQAGGLRFAIPALELVRDHVRVPAGVGREPVHRHVVLPRGGAVLGGAVLAEEALEAEGAVGLDVGRG